MPPRITKGSISTLSIDELTNVKIIEIDAWHSAPDHSRPQTCVDYVDAVVSY